MADFKLSLAVVLANEGGVSYAAADRGNRQPDGTIAATNRGITLYSLTSWRKSQGRPAPTTADVLALSLDETAAIYRANYWQPIGGDAIIAQALATVVFDAAVVSGVAASARVLQQVVAACGLPMVVDGNIGPKTIASVNSLPAGRVLAMFVDRYSDKFSDIVFADASQMAFLPGWRKRRSGWTALSLA